MSGESPSPARGEAPPVRLLLLGSTGLLGGAVAREAEARADVAVIVPDRGRSDLATAGLDDWRALLAESAPAAVLNAAAYARVDRCEENPELAQAVNAEGPGRLALACADADAALLHVSTDYVFGDQQRRGPGPYGESARRAPVQVYGASKAAGEAKVLASGWAVAVARVSWLFGPSSAAFADFVLGQLADGRDEIAVMANQRSRPTWVPDLARWLVDVALVMAADQPRGPGAPGGTPPFLHPAGGPMATRGEWARAILDAAGRPNVRVLDQGAAPASLRAARPADSALDGRRTERWAASRGIAPLVDWRDGVARLGASGGADS